MTARQEQINLLPQKGFESSTAGRVLAWLLSTFRIIVIVTEIIVMIAFLSRFWLDAQNTDLNEKISNKQAVLAASQEFERQFKDVQQRLAIFSDLTDPGKAYLPLLKAINSNLPPDLILAEISIRQNSLEITGTSPSERSIQQFVVNLDANEAFHRVGIVELKSSQEAIQLINFKIRANLETNKDK